MFDEFLLYESVSMGKSAEEEEIVQEVDEYIPGPFGYCNYNGRYSFPEFGLVSPWLYLMSFLKRMGLTPVCQYTIRIL